MTLTSMKKIGEDPKKIGEDPSAEPNTGAASGDFVDLDLEKAKNDLKLSYIERVKETTYKNLGKTHL